MVADPWARAGLLLAILAICLLPGLVVFHIFRALSIAELQALAVANDRKEMLQMMLDSTGEAIYGIDMKGECTFCNPACLRMTGYTREEELLGRNMHDLIHHTHEDGRPFHVEDCRIFQAFREGSGTHVDDEVLWRADGTCFPAEYWSFPQRRDGQVVGAVVTFVDITQRRQAREELVKTADRLALAVRAGGVGIWDYNVVADQMSWDDEMCRMNGLAPGALEAGSSWKASLHPGDLQRVEASFKGALQGFREFDCEYRVILPEGGVRDLRSLALVNRDPAGQPLRMVGISWDITQAKQAAEALQEKSEQRFQGLFKLLPVGVILTDAMGRIIQTNQAFDELLGAPSIHVQDGGSEEPYWEILRPDGSPMPTREYASNRALSEHRRIENMEMGVRRPDGSVAWITASAEPIEQAEMGAIVVYSDVTEQKQMVEALKASENRFRQLAEIFPETIFEATLDGVITYNNDRAYSQFGLSERGFALKKNLFDFVAPQDRERILSRLQERLSGAPGGFLEYRALRADGSSFDALAFVAIIKDKEAPVGLRGFILDISQRKQAEEVLRRSEDRLSQILESTHAGTWEWNVQSGEQVCNERWAQMVGHTLAELQPIGIQTWIDLVHPEDLAYQKALLARHFAGEISYVDSEIRMKHKDGSWVWVHDRGRVTEWLPDGRPLRMFGTHTEITERKRTEQELALRQTQLEELNKSLEVRVQEAVAALRAKDQVLVTQNRQAAMGEMIGNIAHQWRQPLNALSIVMLNIRDSFHFGDLDPAAIEAQLHKGSQLIQSMSTTINDFRNFFRPDKEKTRFSPLEQVRATVSLMEASLQSGGITLTVEAPDGLKLTGFPNEYSQVVLNLLTNAKQAIQHTGIAAGRIHIGLQAEDGHGCLTVGDNGGGIPEACFDRIFEPYFSTRELGTGIGLYMSKRIIEENMHGRISARNIEGGAEFTVRVPLDGGDS